MFSFGRALRKFSSSHLAKLIFRYAERDWRCEKENWLGRAFGSRSVLHKTKATSSSLGAKWLSCFLQQELQQARLVANACLYPSREILSQFGLVYHQVKNEVIEIIARQDSCINKSSKS